MNFLIVAVGRGHPEWTREALNSIASQRTEAGVRVHVVDDASTDGNVGVVVDFVELMAAQGRDWEGTLRRTRRYATENQLHAWTAMHPDDDDVIVFVDLDDRLARTDALEVVRRHYEAGALMTYGSYAAFPTEHPDAATCRPAAPYPTLVRHARAYRLAGVQHFNHLRTISWKLLKHVTDADLRDDAGNYWRANTDRAVMWPCLEMAGPRVAFVPEVLYEYRCDSPDAVWRGNRELLLDEDTQLRRRRSKEVLPCAS